MATGFKDSKGKFRPIKKGCGCSSKHKSIKTSGGIPIYNTNVNNSSDLQKYDKKKPYMMWVVVHPEKSERVKGSETIVMAEHYGQAVDDFITIWNEKKRKNTTIGYPQVQGTIKEE